SLRPRRPLRAARSLAHHSRIASTLRSQNSSHCLHEPLPFRGCRNQLLSTERSQPVVLGAAPVWRCLPLGGDPSALQQALQGGIKRAVVDQKLVVSFLFHGPADAVSMVRAQLQASQNQDLQRSLQELQGAPWIVYGRHSIYMTYPGCFCQQVFRMRQEKSTTETRRHREQQASIGQENSWLHKKALQSEGPNYSGPCSSPCLRASVVGVPFGCGFAARRRQESEAGEVLGKGGR